MTPRKKKSTEESPGKPCKYFLSRERILAAALSIIDNEGFKALSMRRLGKELGVDPMSVYYHIPNKSALLDALVEAVMSSIDIKLDDPGRTSEERLLTAAYTYREALLAHPNLIQSAVCLAPRTPESLRPVEVLLRIFVDAGFSVDDAFSSMNVLASYVRGTVIGEVTESLMPNDETAPADFSQLANQLPPEEFPTLVKVDMGLKCFEPEAIFDRGARALIRGLLEMYGNKEDE